LREDFPQAAALFAECFLRPTFPADEYAKVQRLALGAIARRAGDPHAEISEFFADQLPKGTPYHLLQGGTRKTVERLTAGDLRQYHARYFLPNNMIVTVFGDIDPEKSLALVKTLFGGLKPAEPFHPLSFQRSNALGETIVRHKAIAKQTAMVLFGYPTASMFQKEDYAAMTLLGAVMAGYQYPGGWLHTELRGEGLVYAVQAAQVTGPVPGYFEILAQAAPDKLAEVVARIERNVARAKEGHISRDEFQVAAERVTALHAQENTTIAEQAQQAALYELYGLGYDYEKGFDARIRAVKLDDVVAAARKYFGKHVLVTSAPEKGKK
jgi:zinc protease